MKIRIHPLTAALLAITLLTGDIRLILLSYAVMTGHELSHLAAALCIGLKPDSFTFMPFGVNLRLKNKIVRAFADEIILYASGPLFNGIFALLSAFFGWETLYGMNTALFILNILPIVPLDGGMIALRCLANRIGSIYARRVLNALSLVLSAAFAAAAMCFMLHGELNLSMIIMSLFLLGNIITTKEKYNADFVAAVSGAAKKTNNVKVVLLDNEFDALAAIKTVSPMYTVVAAVKNDNGEIVKLLSEEEILSGINIV